MSQWIDVNERLPEVNQRVIACWGPRACNIAELEWHVNAHAKTDVGRKPRWQFMGRGTDWNVTHWMPLPEPPEDAK